jgi:hypothetical protein
VTSHQQQKPTPLALSEQQRAALPEQDNFMLQCSFDGARSVLVAGA